MKKVEILSPAGNMACLKAAIEAGCDAVYLAGIMFGARAFAGNFSNEELVNAISYAHLYGVKVYLTVNTLIYENEVERFLQYVRFAHKNNVDAVIVQDIGMFDLLRKKFPNLEIHASTQMNVHNFDGAKMVRKMGAKRVVMARETPLSIIKKIKKELDIEVEVFSHGALCVSYSGQCLMSALVGKRSGNRGTCAQICRKKYDLYDTYDNKLNKENYLLSTKDLCTLKHLDELILAGVDSLKIEGRMKRPEYVYLVTKTYRKIVDNYYENKILNLSEKDIYDLKKLFNRCFTKGFMLNEKISNFTYEVRPNHKGVEIGVVLSKKGNDLKIKLSGELNVHDGLRIIDEKEDKGIIVNKMMVNNKSVLNAKKGDVITVKYDKFVKPLSKVLLTTDYNQIKNINDELKNNKRKVLIDGVVTAKRGKPLLIEVNDGKNKVTYESVKKIESSVNSNVSLEMIKKQVNKTGNTVYKFKNIKINLDENVFINVKDINEARRCVLERLSNKRLYQYDFVENDYSLDPPAFKKEAKQGLLIDDLSIYERIKDKYDVIYSSLKNSYLKDLIIKIPRVSNEHAEYKNKVLIADVGALLKYKCFDTDFSFNVVNSYSLAFLHSVGAEVVTLSYELSFRQIQNIIKSYEKRYKKHPNACVIVNSYPEAMISKYDLNKKYGVKDSYLKDSYGNKLLVKSNDGYMAIYHYEKVNLYDKEKLFEIGVNQVRTNIING